MGRRAQCRSLHLPTAPIRYSIGLALEPHPRPVDVGWPRRRRRRRGDVRSNNGPARMGNAEIGTVPDAPGPMDTGSVATEVGVRGNLRSTQLLFVVSGCGEPEGASWERESRSSDLSKVPRSSGNLRSWTCAHGPWEAGHSVDLCLSRPHRSVIRPNVLLATSTRRRRRAREQVQLSNGSARTGDAEIGTVPAVPWHMDTGPGATDAGVRSTQLLSWESARRRPREDAPCSRRRRRGSGGGTATGEPCSNDLSTVTRSSGYVC